MATPMCDAREARFMGLRSACPIVNGSNVSPPLLIMPQGKVVLFAMDAGQDVSELRPRCHMVLSNGYWRRSDPSAQGSRMQRTLPPAARRLTSGGAATRQIVSLLSMSTRMR